MTVYVDQVLPYPRARNACFRAGACHMTADTLDELHAFALRLGLKRAWFQRHGISPHYDLTIGRRAEAVRLGAVETTFKELKAKGLGRTKRAGGTLPDLEEQR